MKVTDVRPLMYGGEYVIVKIETDEGIVGYGDASLAQGREAVLGALESMRLLLLGRDPRRIEQLWQDLYRIVGMVRGGVVYVTALSGIDQALWDIKGKALGVPVHELLGGAVRDKVPAFCYGLPLGDTREEIKDKALAMEAEGWRAFHGDPFRGGFSLAGDLPSVTKSIGQLEAIREAVGTRVEIAIDCHGRFTPAGALRAAQLLAPLQPLWFEEPVPPENTDALARVAHSCSIPIAAGERLYTRWGYRELFEKQAAAVLQPDVCHVGGISELRKLAAVAEMHHITLAPHMIYSPLSVAATLHVDACIPNLIMQGISRNALKIQEEMFKQPVLEVRDGWFTVPSGPGLGVEIDEEKIGRHPYVPSPEDAFRSIAQRPPADQWYRRTAP